MQAGDFGQTPFIACSAALDHKGLATVADAIH
jgi:hypothetical protein